MGNFFNLLLVTRWRSLTFYYLLQNRLFLIVKITYNLKQNFTSYTLQILSVTGCKIHSLLVARVIYYFLKNLHVVRCKSHVLSVTYKYLFYYRYFVGRVGLYLMKYYLKIISFPKTCLCRRLVYMVELVA